jgi:hypothetical protein
MERFCSQCDCRAMWSGQLGAGACCCRDLLAVRVAHCEAILMLAFGGAHWLVYAYDIAGFCVQRRRKWCVRMVHSMQGGTMGV